MKLVLALLALLLFGPAHSGVVYKWETISGLASTLSGRLEVTQTAYQAGSLQYFYDGNRPPGTPWEDLSAPVLMLAFGFYLGADIRSDPIGGGFTNEYRTARTGAEDATDTLVEVSFGESLLGTISGGGNDASLEMSSDSTGLWTIRSFLVGQSDSIGLDGCSDACEGVTGRWILDRSTVPTPGTLSIALLALAVLGSQRQRSPSA